MFSNGEEWYRMRQHVHILLKLKMVHSYWPRQQAVAEEFADFLLLKCNFDGIVKDFIQHAFVYSLEGNNFPVIKHAYMFINIYNLIKAIGVVCYGKRLKCLSNQFEECNGIVQANINFLKALGETFHQPPWWKIWKTKAYKTIEESQDFMMT